MKKLSISLLTICLFLVASITSQAADLISVAEAAKIMRQKDVVIVSAQKMVDYKKTHIMNSVHIDHNTLYNNEPIKSVIKSPADMAAILGKLGISETKTIIVYDNGSGKYSGRLYWILKYLGAPNVKILDGQIKAWKAARKPITKNPTMVKPATFTPKANKSIISTMAQTKATSGIVLDVRAANEYAGTDESELRKGHIPGAKNIEFKQVLDANSKMKSADQLKTLFEGKGITKDKEVILYCTSSVRTGIVYNALVSVLGYTNVKVYDGAFYEWSASSNSVEK